MDVTGTTCTRFNARLVALLLTTTAGRVLRISPPRAESNTTYQISPRLVGDIAYQPEPRIPGPRQPPYIRMLPRDRRQPCAGEPKPSSNPLIFPGPNCRYRPSSTLSSIGGQLRHNMYTPCVAAAGVDREETVHPASEGSHASGCPRPGSRLRDLTQGAASHSPLGL